MHSQVARLLLLKWKWHGINTAALNAEAEYAFQGIPQEQIVNQAAAMGDRGYWHTYCNVSSDQVERKAAGELIWKGILKGYEGIDIRHST